MRVVRVLVGIMLVTVAVLGFLSGGALWIATQHASADGGFGGQVSGLSTKGSALVVPAVDAMLRDTASLTGHSGTSVSLTATTGGAPAFIGLAPIAAIRTYLGTTAYGRVTSVHMSGGLLASVIEVPSTRRTVALAKPATLRFWTRSATGGRLVWSPSNKAYDQLALVIMRADGAGPVEVTAQAEVSAGWLTSTIWALFALGTVVAVIAVALLMWPSRRREIVYVVTPTQMPEIAERLGVPLEQVLPPETPVPTPRAEESEPSPEPTPEPTPSWAGPTPGPWQAAPTVRATAAAPRSAQPTIPAIFADPLRRPNSLRTAMLLNPASAREAGSTAPMPTNERGIYRSFGTPPPVTPAFLWTPTESEVAD
jgi:hypothetical protein